LTTSRFIDSKIQVPSLLFSSLLKITFLILLIYLIMKALSPGKGKNERHDLNDSSRRRGRVEKKSPWGELDEKNITDADYEDIDRDS
jgi:hypothetical protein